jgi:PiT family inorganic phosphate transporter
MGVFMLGMFLAENEAGITDFQIPLWLMVLCSATMALGTSIGGYRIIKAVGMDMVKLEKHQGFSADLSSVICLLLALFGGLPVSTTHTKTTAIMGVGAAKRITYVNWKIVGEMLSAWALTFPGCGLIGYLMALLFMRIF